ncbi:MAG: hypothetical protein C0444_11110 [Microbacterium sp.]|nr:hypothetical protein [Microbacterium sp.]MBA4346746.1 hypothetical protein [Microbacterium sp.]
MSTPITRSTHWSTAVVNQLRDATRCPVCGRTLRDGLCTTCGADLRGDTGVAVWTAATAAAAALTTLEKVVASIPKQAVEPYRAAVVAAPPAVAPPTQVAPARASTTLQSVLAVAGAGLLATAALVFTFLNPDLTDPIARAAVLGGAAVLFVAGAPVLMRRALRVSAECVAALGVIFVALSAAALGELAPAGANPWAGATIGALVGGSLALTLGLRTRIRSWMLSGTLALPLVPLLASAALTDASIPLWGPLGSAAAALALIEAARVLERRRGVDVRVERALLVVVQLIALTLLVWLALDLPPVGDPRWLALSAAALGVGAVVGRSARHALRALFSGVAGLSVALALVLATFALDTAPLGGEYAFVVIVPLAAGVGLIGLTALTTSKRSVRRSTVLAGAMSVVVVSVLPAASLAGLVALIALVNAERVAVDASTAAAGLAAVLGLLVVSAVLASHARVIRARAGRPTAASIASRAAAFWVLGFAGVGATGLVQVDGVARAIAAIVLVGAASIVFTATPLGRRASTADRVPIVIAAHAALVIAASLSWGSSGSVGLAVTLAPAVLAALVALAMTVPRVFRPAHLAVGSAYALVILASALSLTGIEFVGLVSITATAGLLVAVAATLISRVSTDYWMTLLIVAVVPALMAVGLVLVERTAWVMLSTSTLIVLAVSVMLTHRRALSAAVRALAAAAIVPSIAVVIVNLGAVALESSGSPFVLPVIAAVVAGTLPVLSRLEAALRARGLDDNDANTVVLALEVTTWLTAAIAIMLSITRDAAGLEITTLVLALLALGAGAAAAVRRISTYWWLSGIIATAALWCGWFVLGVTSPEAHLLPPALAVVAVATVLTARGRPRAGLYGAGLLGAILPVLGLIAAGDDPSPARTIALLSTAAGLTVVGALLATGRPGVAGRLSPLRAATLGAAIVASMAGAAQGTRFGIGLDVVDAPSTVTLAPIALALALALAGAVPAAIAGLLLARDATPDQRRWALVPAITALVVAACSAIEVDPLPVWVISLVGLALLITMVVAVWRERSHATALPRAWVLFALALVTAIVAWSSREFVRVEAFSVPLGAMLLLAGVITFVRGPSAASAPLHHWPVGRRGSWALLSPGIVVLVLRRCLPPRPTRRPGVPCSSWPSRSWRFSSACAGASRHRSCSA